MTALQQAYERCTSEQRTQVVSVVGNSGLGKTRLVCEFYSWLSKTHDSGEAGYWPPTLLTESAFGLNPQISNCNKKVLPPFFWAGMRLPDPKASHNRLGSALQSGAAFFGAHLQEFYEYLRAQKPGAAVTALGKAAGIELAFDKIVDVAADLVPIPGFKALMSVARAVFDTAGENENSEDMAAFNAEQRYKRSEDLVATAWLETLEALYSVKGQNEQSKRLGRVLARPLVLFIDDAQWIEQDASLAQFLEKLLSHSAWPVMVVLTCWEVKWNQGALVRELVQLNDKLSNTVVQLRPHEDLSRTVISALPGIDANDVKQLVEKAGGNPAALAILLGSFLDFPRYFEGLDTSNALNARGKRKLEASTAVHEDIRKLTDSVLRDAGEEFRAVLALSAWQGLRFLEPLSVETSKLLGKTWLVQSVLRSAASNYALLEGDVYGVNEFAQRIYWEASRDALADVITPDQQSELLVSLVPLISSLLESKTERSAKLVCSDVAMSLYKSGKTKGSAIVLCRAAMELSNDARRRFDFTSAAHYAESFDRVFRERRLGVKRFDRTGLLLLADSLEYASVERAGALLKKLASVASREADLRYYATVLGQAARVARKTGKPEAQHLSDECVAVFSEIHAREGSARSARDLSVALGLRADLSANGYTQVPVDPAFTSDHEAFDYALRAFDLVRPHDDSLTDEGRRDIVHALTRLSRLAPDAIQRRVFAEESILHARVNAAVGSLPYAERDLALALLAQVDAILELREPEGAKAPMRKCIALLVKLERVGSWTARRDLALALWRSSQLHRMNGDYVSARSDMDRSIELLRRLQGPQSVLDSFIAVREAANLARRSGDMSAALDYECSLQNLYQELANLKERGELWGLDRVGDWSVRRDLAKIGRVSPSLATRWNPADGTHMDWVRRGR